MNKNLPTTLAAIAAIVALASVVSAVRSSSLRKASEAEVTSLREQIARMEADNPVPDEAPLAVYQGSPGSTNEVAQLRAMLAERNAELAMLKARPELTEEERQQQREERRQQQRESFEQRMAQFKEEDPEGYAEMVAQRQERQQTMRYNLAERTATFMDLDTSRMTAAELANHEKLVEKMANVWQLTEQFNDPEQPPDRETMRELFNDMREVRPLMEQERTVMFKQLGTVLGYEGEEAEAFAAHVEDIISATTLQMPRGGGRGGPGRGRGDGRGGQ